jgi:hypothetical protein
MNERFFFFFLRAVSQKSCCPLKSVAERSISKNHFKISS